MTRILHSYDHRLCNLDINATVDRIDMIFKGADVRLNQFNNRTLTIAGMLDFSDPDPPRGLLALTGDTYTMSSTGNNTDLIAGSGGLVIGADPEPGLIQMSNFSTNRIYTDVVDDPIFIQTPITIEGAGQIDINRTALNNQGVINANQTVSLTIDPSGSGAINSGIMQASGDGTLILNSGTFTNFDGLAEGLIREENATIKLQSSTVTGGTVEVVGAGNIQLSSSITDGILNNSTTGIIRTTAGTNTIGGTFTNLASGLLTLNNNTTFGS